MKESLWSIGLGALCLFPLLLAMGSLLAWLTGKRVLKSSQRAETRASGLRWSLSLPLLVSVAGFILVMLPCLLGELGVTAAHCIPDHAGHAHVCPLHLPGNLQGPASLLAILGAGWAGHTLAVGLWSLRRLRLSLVSAETHLPDASLPVEFSQKLAHGRLALPDSASLPIEVHRAPLPFAALTGLLSPKVVLTASLVELLTEEELTAVVLHELAHHQRGDVWMEAVRPWLISFHLPFIGPWLSRQLQAETESTCDLQAAQWLSSGLPGASALVRLQRWALEARRELLAGLTVRETQPLSVGLTQPLSADPVSFRVHRLLSWTETEAPPLRPSRWLVWGPVMGALGLVLLQEPLHHALEDLLGFLAG